MIFECASLQETIELGRQIGCQLEDGDVIALHGDLGAGKTTIVSGIAMGAGVPQDYAVTSPTFVLMHEYPGRLKIFHLDFYRISRFEEIRSLGLDEFIGLENVCIVEWFEKFPSVWTGDTIHLYLSMKNETTRIVELRPTGVRSQRLIDKNMENGRA